jgi:hypothetical protein
LELEGALQGIQKNSGIEFGLVYKPGSTTDILDMFVTSSQDQMQQLKTLNVEPFLWY